MRPEFVTRFLGEFHEKFREGDPHADHKRAEMDNVGALRRQYEAVVAGDFATALGLMAADVELDIVGPPCFPFAGRWRGRDEVGRALGRNVALVADQEPEVVSLTAQGDTVVVVARERGRGVPTGRTYDVHWVQVFRFRDGELVHVREVADTGSLLAAT
ncbi:MAG: SnoaL-like domain protein [Gemmataceae bacterium]|nr:SnoaL-like domain protein [Gemmataceae bacterium]